MKINKTKELTHFFSRCLENLQSDYYNDYISVIIQDSEDEKAIIQELKYLGSHQFDDDSSLYMSSLKHLDNPYNKSIDLKGINSKGFEYKNFVMPKDELINIDVIQDDPDKELNDYIILKAFDEPFTTRALLQNGEFWMTDNPAESITIDPCAKKAYGKVLTFGLGLGYFPFMALENPEVTSVTIVEYSKTVIDLFKEYILPQFKHKDKIEIINGDAFKYFNKEFIAKFDYVFVDIWKDNSDGLEAITRMLENYNPPFEKVDFWIERTCVEPVICTMLSYFQLKYEGNKLPDIRLYHKIDKYFKNKDLVIVDSNQIKDIVYDRKIIRDVLSVRV